MSVFSVHHGENRNAVMECLAAHAERVFAGIDRKTSDAKYLLRRIREIGGEFNKRELWARVRRRFSGTDSFDDTLRMLEEAGYIRLEVIQGRGYRQAVGEDTGKPGD